MPESKMHIVVLSKNSVRKYWPLLEFRKAFDDHFTKGKVMVIIMLGDVQNDEIPEFARNLLPQTVCLQWETNDNDAEYVHVVDRDKYRLFWAKLIAKLYGVKDPFIPTYFPCRCLSEFNASNLNDLWHDNMPLIQR